MGYYREIQCHQCGTLVGIKEVNITMPYRTEETVECPIYGMTIFRHNSRGDFKSEVISTENTLEPYKLKISK